MKALLPLAALLLSACSHLPTQPTQPAADDPAARAALLEPVAWQRVRADMQALSSDAMEGRATGTPGHERAALWVAERFAALGLRPLGVGEGPQAYLQPVPLIESRLEAASLRLDTPAGPLQLAFPQDFVSFGGFGPAQEAVQAPLVFAGHGIVAPGHDDYAGLDVRGRIVVLFSGAPASLAVSERAFYSALDEKQAQAQARGALGLLLLQTPVDQRRMAWPQMVEAAQRPSMRWRTASGAAQGPAALPSATLSPQAATRLFAASGRELSTLFEQHRPAQGFALDSTAQLTRRSQQNPLSSPNVIGLLPGSDPQLRDELLLVSAHLDHLGLAPEGAPDRVFNGAYDNAAGVAVMLELARVLRQAPGATRRSLLFVAFTAEEQGMRGSDYLAQHPPLPQARLIANLNIDMPYLGYPARDVEGYGAAHSSLEDSLRQAAQENDLTLSPDSRPDLVRLIRSDQVSFVKQGVPGLNLKPGLQSADPAIDGAAVQQRYLSQHYHRPSDDDSLPFSPEGAQRFTRAAGTLALLLANGAERPRWRAGDFFGERFGKPQ